MLKEIAIGLLVCVLWAAMTLFLTWIKDKWPQHGERVRYALISAATLGVIWFVATGRPLLSFRPASVNAENANEAIKLWLSHTLLSVREFSQDDYRDTGMRFGFIATATGSYNRNVVIESPSDHREQLIIYAMVKLGQPFISALNSLPESEHTAASRMINLELARTGTIYDIDLTKGSIRVSRLVMLDDVSEQRFFDNLAAVESAEIVAQAAAQIAIAKDPSVIKQN